MGGGGPGGGGGGRGSGTAQGSGEGARPDTDGGGHERAAEDGITHGRRAGGRARHARPPFAARAAPADIAVRAIGAQRRALSWLDTGHAEAYRAAAFVPERRWTVAVLPSA